MIMRPDRTGIDPPAPRHAEVKDHAVAAIRFDNPVFRTAQKPRDPRARHPLAQVNRDRAAQIGAAYIDAHQARAKQRRLQPAHRCFDFGKFRHTDAIEKQISQHKPYP